MHSIDLIKESLDHGCDGPITPFVLISRAIDYAIRWPASRENIANALDELLTHYGWLNHG